MRHVYPDRSVTATLILLLLITSSSGAKEKEPHSQPPIPPGTEINVRLKDKLRSDKTKAGDQFRGKLDTPILADGRVLYPKGTEVGGYVVRSHASARPGDAGVLELDLLSVGGGANMTALSAKTLVLRGESIKAPKGAPGKVAAGDSAPRGETVVDSSSVLKWVTTPPNSAPNWLTHPPSDTRRGSTGTPFRIVHRNEAGDIEDSPPPARSFSDQDRQLLRACLARKRSSSPQPAKKNTPPFPAAKQPQKNGTLSPELRKQAEPLPAQCTQRLTPIPQKWARVVLGSRVLLLDPGSRIADVFVY
jgi:hypothetical protein